MSDLSALTDTVQASLTREDEDAPDDAPEEEPDPED